MSVKGPFYYIELSEHATIIDTVKKRPVIYMVIPTVNYEGARTDKIHWFTSLIEAKEYGQCLLDNENSDISVDSYEIHILLDGGITKILTDKNISEILEIEKTRK